MMKMEKNYKEHVKYFYCSATIDILKYIEKYVKKIYKLSIFTMQ